MLKVTSESKNHESVTLRVEGRLVGKWAQELQMICEMHLQTGHQVVLVLTGVYFSDSEGVRILKALRSRQTKICGCSLYLRELLGPEV